MIVLTLLWVALAVCEGITYVRLPVRQSLGRNIWLSILLLALLASGGLRLWTSWHAWALFCLLALYRIVNMLRFWRARLQVDQLRSATLRAHIWLVTMQTFVLAVGSVVNHWHLGYRFLAVTAVLQLLVAVLLLRSTLHTWQHTEPFASAQPLTDRELPTVSVLIPARNETDELQRCLDRLVTSQYPKLEVIVLDDNSANRRTPEIIRSFAQDGVRFVQGAVPDETNWLAKNHAYARLRQEASGELLLFCGVDVQFDAGSLRQLVEVMLERQKNMLSVLPLKDSTVKTRLSLLQPMRYYWEICLPRRFFKRPPVLSTCWLIRASALDRAGGFEAVKRSMTPEAYFARQSVVTDAYSFVRSNEQLGIYSMKAVDDQYDTSVRTRYPQLHRRLELVALTTLAELAFLLGPIVGLCLLGFLSQAMAFAAMWGVSVACLLVTYYLVAVATKLNNPFLAWLLMPFAFVGDIVVQHVSMYKYEFSRVDWKGRDAAVPVMRMAPAPQTPIK